MKEEFKPLRDYAGRMINATSNYYHNLNQEFIFTTEDKIRLSLIKHLAKTEKRKAWITPLSIFITILIIFPTTTFNPFLSFSENTWEALFLISGVICFCWLIFSIWQAKTSSSLNDIIREIKESTGPTEIRSMQTSQITHGQGVENISFIKRKQQSVDRKDKIQDLEKSKDVSLKEMFDELYIETGYGEKINFPSIKDIIETLSSVPVGKNSFVILSRLDQDTYMQTLKISNSLYFLEYQDGSIEKHYDCIDPNLDIPKIIKAFLSFAKNDNSWKKDFHWILMDEAELKSRIAE